MLPCLDPTRTRRDSFLFIAVTGFVVGAALSGCAGLDPDGAAFDSVQQAARVRLGHDLVWSRSAADQAALDRRVAALLSQVLTVDAAVQLALLNNRGLQASLFELGVADADLLQAATLPNPA